MPKAVTTVPIKNGLFHFISGRYIEILKLYIDYLGFDSNMLGKCYNLLMYHFCD